MPLHPGYMAHTSGMYPIQQHVPTRMNIVTHDTNPLPPQQQHSLRPSRGRA